MKNRLIIISAVSITAAYLFGTRISGETMAVSVGALCGIAASIPISLALFLAINRNWGQVELSKAEPSRTARRPRSPRRQVVVINPSEIKQSNYTSQAIPFYLPRQIASLGPPREFKIVGDE